MEIKARGATTEEAEAKLLQAREALTDVNFDASVSEDYTYTVDKEVEIDGVLLTQQYYHQCSSEGCSASASYRLSTPVRSGGKASRISIETKSRIRACTSCKDATDPDTHLTEDAKAEIAAMIEGARKNGAAFRKAPIEWDRSDSEWTEI